MTAGYTFVAPNLTPDPETGHIYDWDLDTFMKRMKKGASPPDITYALGCLYSNGFGGYCCHIQVP